MVSIANVTGHHTKLTVALQSSALTASYAEKGRCNVGIFHNGDK